MNRALPTFVLLELAALAAAQQPAAPATPAAPGAPWRDALVLARSHHAPILAFVLPADAPADPRCVQSLQQLEHGVGMLLGPDPAVPAPRTTRELLLRELQLLRRGERQGRGASGPSTAQAIFALTVPVVCRAEDCGAKPGENVVLVAEDGRRTHGFALELQDRDAFVRRVGEVVLAPGAVAARRANVAPALAADLARRARLAAANGADPKDALELGAIEQRLLAALPGVAPALVEHVGGAVRLAPALAELEVQRAPLGTRAEVQRPDPCPACGMGFVPPELSTVLHLIGP